MIRRFGDPCFYLVGDLGFSYLASCDSTSHSKMAASPPAELLPSSQWEEEKR